MTHFSTIISLLINSEVSIVVLTKRMFEFSEAPVHKCFEKKKGILKVFENFPKKHHAMLESFLSTLGAFQKGSVENLYTPVSVKRISTAMLPQEFSRNLKTY